MRSSELGDFLEFQTLPQANVVLRGRDGIDIPIEKDMLSVTREDTDPKYFSETVIITIPDHSTDPDTETIDVDTEEIVG